MRVGYLSNGKLKTRDLVPIPVRDDTGTEIGITSVAQQFESLYAEGYRMVEDLNFDELARNSPELVVVPEPYLDGEVVRYKYTEKTPSNSNKMNGIKETLGETDHVIIKAMEDLLLNNITPTEATIKLINERKALRSEYNNLEKLNENGEAKNLS